MQSQLVASFRVPAQVVGIEWEEGAGVVERAMEEWKRKREWDER